MREIDMLPGGGSSRSDVWRLTLGRLLTSEVQRMEPEPDGGELREFMWSKTYAGMGDALDIAMAILMGTKHKFMRATVLSVRMNKIDDVWVIHYTRDMGVSPPVAQQEAHRAEDDWFSND